MTPAERLRQARHESGLTMEQVAGSVGTTVTTIWRYEAGQRRPPGMALYALASLYGKSVEWLSGSGESGEGEEDASVRPSGFDGRPVEVLELASAAGSGADVYEETPVGQLWFRRDWLREHGIDPDLANVIGVSGASMEPTLPDGCSILVDRARREPVEGRIYVMRTEEGLVVKRVCRDESGRWQACSDNPDYEPSPMLFGTEIIGEVRWSGRTF